LKDVSDAKNAKLDKREKNLLLKKGVTPQGTPASGTALEAARTAADAERSQKKPLVGLKQGANSSNTNNTARPGFEGKGKATGKSFLNSKSSGNSPSGGSFHGNSKSGGPNPVKSKGK
jgi:hypothetical protein